MRKDITHSIVFYTYQLAGSCFPIDVIEIVVKYIVDEHESIRKHVPALNINNLFELYSMSLEKHNRYRGQT